MQNDNELQREADEAVRVLKEGGIILYPTDTVWGLGCDATNAEAVERIYKLKRSENKKSTIAWNNVLSYTSRYCGSFLNCLISSFVCINSFLCLDF